MRGKVLRSFVSNQPRVRASRGEIIELPEDVDWVRAGLVEELPDEEPPVIELDDSDLPDEVKKYTKNLRKMVENTSLKTPEKAVTRSTGKQPASKKPASRSKTSSRKTMK